MGTSQSLESDALDSRQQAFINQRWVQLSELEKEWGKDAIKYLMLTNAGGAVAVLGFIGSSNGKIEILVPAVALSLFLGGIVVTGAMVAYAHHTMSSLFGGWQRDVAHYNRGEMSFNDLIELDDKRVPSGKVDKVLGYIGFACFFLGAAAGCLALLSKTSEASAEATPLPQVSKSLLTTSH